MQPNNAMRIRKKYMLIRWLSLLLIIAFFAIKHFIGYSDILLNFLTAACFAFYFPFLARCSHWYVYAIRNALLQDLDLAEYNARLAALKWDINSPIDIVISAYAGGDHQRVLNTVQSIFTTTKRPPLHYIFLSFLSISQFMRGDRENLANTLAVMERLAKENRKTKKLSKKDNLLRFLRHFLDGNLDACERDCQEMLLRPKLNAISRLLWEWLPTTVYIERGESERAKEALTTFLARPKNLPGFVEVAQKQLLDLGEKDGYRGLDLRLVATSLPSFPAFEKSIKRNRLVSILAVFAIVMSLASGILNYAEQKEFSEEIAASVAEAMPGEQAELLTRFYVTVDDNIIDDICILRRANGKLLVGSNYLHVGDDTLYFRPYCTDMESFDLVQMPAIFDNTYTVSYRLYQNKQDVPENALHTEKLKLDGKTLYFCVTEIKKN